MKSSSVMSDQIQLAHAIYLDACARSSALSPDLRDLDTMRSRVEHEGLSFLTITLPSFARDIERCLEQGWIDSSAFRSFGKHGAIPAFLQGMTSLIFDRGTGRIINYEPFSLFSIADILVSVRQICLAFKKIETPCTEKRNHEAIKGYVDTELALESFELSREDRDYFSLVSSVCWDNLFGALCLSTVIPRHGPGATADKLAGNRKFIWRTWHERLEPFFPLLEYGYFISAFDSEEFENVTFLSRDEELPVKVTLVPKTLKAPRIIAIEPCCMQYTQQGIRRIIYDAIESYRLTSGHVNFTDQSINRSLAMKSSMDGQLATIDLSDASDRVPLDLVSIMFRSNPDLWDAILACRSDYARLPDGSIIGPLRKFASMGSALCFPIEAMYFYTCCVVALLRARGLPVTHENIFNVSRDVYVYGDDIIVPVREAETVFEHLRKYNCKVNTNKTFYLGRFRESCGIDAYDGVEVTPIYIHHLAPENRQQADVLVSWIQTARSFFSNGYERTARFMFERCESILGLLPLVPDGTSCLGRNSYLGFLASSNRYNGDTHCREIRAWVTSPVYRTDELEGYGALMKTLLPDRTEDPFGFKEVDNLHLSRTALHGAVALKLRWVPTHLWG